MMLQLYFIAVTILYTYYVEQLNLCCIVVGWTHPDGIFPTTSTPYSVFKSICHDTTVATIIYTQKQDESYKKQYVNITSKQKEQAKLMAF